MTIDEFIEKATDSTFEEVVVKSDIPVMVDFWAPWCAPCHMVAPVIEKLSIDYAGKIKFVKINVDEAQQVSQSMNIEAIPTIVVFNKGNAVSRQVGAQPRDVLEKMIQDSLKN